MAMADLVMPRLPDQQPAWFHQQPHQHQSTGHQRSFSSHHMPQQTQQQQLQQLQFQAQQHQLQQHLLQQHQQMQQQQQLLLQQQAQISQPPRQSPPFNSNSSDISPLSTSSNTSPVSPKNYHGRQVRPLYMPAVLRPNEYPSSANLAKISPGLEEADDEDRAVRTSSSFTSLSGILSLSRLARRDSAKVVDWDWNLSNYPQVNGQPTRRHWKADQECDVCDDPTCKKYFNYFVRRHHCRRCGNIFCDMHSNREVPLDESANYNPRGQPSRCCEHCFGDFKAWRSRTSSQASSLETSRLQHQPFGGSKTVPASPVSASPMSGASPTTPGKSQPEVALSVPSDWNWSTF